MCRESKPQRKCNEKKGKTAAGLQVAIPGNTGCINQWLTGCSVATPLYDSNSDRKNLLNVIRREYFSQTCKYNGK